MDIEMDAERWQAIEALFHGARELPTSQRTAYVRAFSGGDAEIMREVVALLDEDSGSDDLDGAPAFVQTEEPEAGQTIGAYRIVRRIGRGGMGSVYLAERADDVFEKKVALKVMSGGGPGLARRFQKERQILASLEHPNITRLLDGGVTDQRVPFLVMEYVDGETLGERARTLALNEKLSLMVAICDAVHYAHQRLVIHRDLKPGNVMVTADGTPKLLDFGIAKLLGQTDGGSREETVTQVAMMTPKYASPEQLHGESVSTLSDVYSLGVMLEELCGAQAPRDVRKIAGKARQLMTENRYAAAAEMRDDLRRYLNGDAVLPEEDTIRYRLGKFVSRNRGSVAAAGSVLLAIILAAVISLWQANVARQERNRAEAINGFLLRLLENGDPERSQLTEQGAALKVVDVLDQAARDLDRDWKGEVATESALRHVLARSYLGMAKYENAKHQATVELNRAIAAHGNESIQAAEAHRNLAAAYAGLLEHGKSEPEWEAAIVLFRKNPKTRARMLEVLGEMSDSYALAGKHTQAVTFGEEALAGMLASAGDNRAQLGKLYCSAALAYRELQRPEKQREYFSKGIAILKQLPQPPFLLGECVHNFAVQFADAGDYAKSVQLNEEAIGILRKRGGNDHLYLAVTLISRAASLAHLNRAEEAYADAGEALNIALKLYPRKHDWPAYMLTMYGGIECDTGRVPEGLAKLRESYESRKGYYTALDPQLASLKASLGRCLARTEELEQAEQMLRQAYDIYLKIYGEADRFASGAKRELDQVIQRRSEMSSQN